MLLNTKQFEWLQLCVFVVCWAASVLFTWCQSFKCHRHLCSGVHQEHEQHDVFIEIREATEVLTQTESSVQQHSPHPLRDKQRSNHGRFSKAPDQADRSSFVYDELKLTMLLGNADQIQSLLFKSIKQMSANYTAVCDIIAY